MKKFLYIIALAAIALLARSEVIPKDGSFLRQLQKLLHCLKSVALRILRHCGDLRGSAVLEEAAATGRRSRYSRVSIQAQCTAMLDCRSPTNGAMSFIRSPQSSL